MNWPLLIFFLCFAATFLLRIPIGPGMMMSAIFYFVLAPGPAAGVGVVASQFLMNLNTHFILIAVPLFIFTANVMNSGAITDMVFNFATSLVGRWKGSLAHVNVIDSLIFSGMTGSAIADATGPGLMEIRAMRSNGYDDAFACALTASSATIGPVFPPSIPMVFYSMLSGASIGALFMGGMIPGILMAGYLMAYVAIVAVKRNYPKGKVLAPKAFLLYTLRALPALATPVILLGGIYTGIVTATEAGALAGFWALLISIVVYRVMGWRKLYEILVDTVRTIGIVTIIVGAAYAYAYIVSIEHIPDLFANLILGVTQNKYLFLLIVNLLFLVLGMFLDVMTITLVFIPMVLPLVQALGIDLVHFGVVIVLNMMIGLLTPPFGALLFVVSGISGTPMKLIIKETFPMIVVLVLVLFLITYVPELVLFVPRLLGQ